MSKNHFAPLIVIGILPLLLMIFAAQWSSISMEKHIRRAEVLFERSEQQLSLLHTKFRNVQRAYTLLLEGEEKTPYRSVAYFEKKDLKAAVEKHWDATQQITALKQRIDAMTSRLNAIGKKTLHINLGDQMVSMIEDGEIIRKYPISSGAWETPTPLGTFEISRKQELRVSSQEIAYRMPYYMAFTPNQSHGLHALPYLGAGPESSDYWQEALSHVGTPVSHGCVRLLPEDAFALYSWIEVGTPVIINS